MRKRRLLIPGIIAFGLGVSIGGVIVLPALLKITYRCVKEGLL